MPDLSKTTFEALTNEQEPMSTDNIYFDGRICEFDPDTKVFIVFDDISPVLVLRNGDIVVHWHFEAGDCYYRPEYIEEATASLDLKELWAIRQTAQSPEAFQDELDKMLVRCAGEYVQDNCKLSLDVYGDEATGGYLTANLTVNDHTPRRFVCGIDAVSIDGEDLYQLFDLPEDEEDDE